jgi:hypothetical protein
MILKKFTQIICSIFLVSLLLLTSCSSQPPSRFEQAQQESLQAGNRNTAVVKEAEAGSSFNKFFPPSDNNYERVFTQEKNGFAQAKLKQNGVEVAMISVFDTLSNNSTVDDFQNTSDTIKGYPSVEKGANSTAVLVNNRFQVKITSRDVSFSQKDRILWLEKFNLDGLSKLQ